MDNNWREIRNPETGDLEIISIEQHNQIAAMQQRFIKFLKADANSYKGKIFITGTMEDDMNREDDFNFKDLWTNPK